MLRRLGLLGCLAPALLGGCFYVEDINERPSAEIQRIGSGVPARGSSLQFRAMVHDPDGDGFHTSWRFEACGLANTCAAVATGTDPLFPVTVPRTVDGAPTVHIAVTLDVLDEHNAVARPQQRLDLDVVNNAPRVIVQASGREIDGAFPPDVPITVSAVGEDEDMDALTLTWEYFPPRASVPTDRYFIRMPDTPQGHQEYELFPDVDGEWTVRVTVSDGITGDDYFVDEPILVVPDSPPCLGATDPPAVVGSRIILDEPRRLSVLVVEDDLDVYPPPPLADPYLDVAGFRWYLRGPGTGGNYVQVAGGVAGLELDPAQYDPGDLLDVRVEIDDRIGRTVQCAADVPTCSIEQNACLQRQTWSLEVR